MFEPYCPECGAVEITEIKGIHFDGSHMHCEKCYQDFFKDVDYSRAIGFNLRKMKKEIELLREQLKVCIEALKEIDMARFPENGVEFTDVLSIADDCLAKLKQIELSGNSGTLGQIGAGE